MTSTGSASSLAVVEREHQPPLARRKTLVRRALVIADLIGISFAFATTALLFGFSADGAHARPLYVVLVFVVSLPAWAILAGGHGLYRNDHGRMGHSTVDELVGIVHLVTLGAWLFFVGCWATSISDPRPGKLIAFWLIAIASVGASRSIARHLCRSSSSYIQNTIIVGGGNVGQLVARKVLQHPEYGLRLLGLVDAEPTQRRGDLDEVKLLGPIERLGDIVRQQHVERVILAFSNTSDAQTAEIARELRSLDVQLDIVPRLYELIGPRLDVHSVEGLSILGLASSSPSHTALRVKRALDVVGASVGLIVLSPLLAFIALKIRHSSPGPAFFRQARLGLEMNVFTALKFRTMWVDTDDAEHRGYIARTSSADPARSSNGLYKPDRKDAVTPFGRWLRRTSLDELPQLINVLRGEMSLVGPRPCIPYETQYFKPHHFERFLMPAGLTGLWQTTARAHASFGEALDIDVAYVRGWSLGLDLRLLFRTPLQLLAGRGTA